MATYAHWQSIASGSGASGLSSITDASYAGDPAGTDCNASYWNGRAYDQLTAIFNQLGTNPGSGSDSNFTINQDATGNESSSIRFATGGALQQDPSFGWNASLSAFTLSNDLVSAIELGASGTRISKLWATNTDVSGTLDVGGNTNVTGNLDVDGTSTLQGVTVAGTLTTSSLSVSSSLSIAGTAFTLNSDASGMPSESSSIIVERGSATDAAIRWYETGNNSTSKWQAYNLSDSAYDTIALLNSSGFTSSDVFSGSHTGSSNHAARADHSHTGGSLDALGTNETTFTVDADYSSGSANIELRFASASNYIRYNPGAGTTEYTFSDTINVPGATLSSATITNDLTLSGAISGDLNVKGTILKVDSDAGSKSNTDVYLGVSLGSDGNRWLRWNGDSSSANGGKWQFTNDASAYYDLIGTDSSNNISFPANVTITGDLTSSLDIQGTTLTLRSGSEDNADALFRVKRGVDDYATIKYESDSGGSWKACTSSANYSDIVLHDKAQTLTQKTLTAPSISGPTMTGGGTWSGNPSFSGNPAFSGTPTFVGATFSGRPAFNSSYQNGSPFTVGTNSVLVSSLNVDAVDGKHVSDSETSTGYLWTANKIQAQIDSSSGAAHASTHGATGSDAISGTTNISGTTQDTFTIQTGATNPATIQLGSTSKFRVQIKDYGNNRMGIGGQNVSVVPQNTGQSLGDSSNRWDQFWVKEYANFDLIASSDYPSTNGSLWFASGSPSSFMVRLGGTIHTLVNSSGVSNNNHSHSGYLSTGGGTLSGMLTINADLNVNSSLLYAAAGYDKVGIGYTPSSGGGKLEVYGGNSWTGTGESIAKFRSQGADARIHIYSGSAAYSTHKAYAIYEDKNTSSQFSTGLDGGAYKITTGTTLSGTERLKIDSSGNWTTNSGQFNVNCSTLNIDNSSGTPRLEIDSSGNFEVGDSGTNYNAKFHGNTGAKAYWNWYSGGGIDKFHYMKRYQPSQGSAYALMHINAGSESSSPGYNLIVSGTIYHSGIYQSSDSRLKSNIANIETALDNVTQLQGVTFNWKENEELEFDVPVKGEGRQYGFIAQDVEKVLPDIVQTDNVKSLKYDALIPMLVEAIKELKAEVDELKASR